MVPRGSMRRIGVVESRRETGCEGRQPHTALATTHHISLGSWWAGLKNTPLNTPAPRTCELLRSASRSVQISPPSPKF